MVSEQDKKRTLDEAVVFIIFQDDKLLAEKRPLTKKFDGGLTIIPGGGIEPGESREQALMRECEEELSIKVASYTYVCSLYHSKENPSLLHYYVVGDYAGEIKANEGQELV